VALFEGPERKVSLLGDYVSGSGRPTDDWRIQSLIFNDGSGLT
jgi:hypothetical protein